MNVYLEALSKVEIWVKVKTYLQSTPFYTFPLLNLTNHRYVYYSLKSGNYPR